MVNASCSVPRFISVIDLVPFAEPPALMDKNCPISRLITLIYRLETYAQIYPSPDRVLFVQRIEAAVRCAWRQTVINKEFSVDVALAGTLEAFLATQQMGIYSKESYGQNWALTRGIPSICRAVMKDWGKYASSFGQEAACYRSILRDVATYGFACTPPQKRPVTPSYNANKDRAISIKRPSPLRLVRLDGVAIQNPARR